MFAYWRYGLRPGGWTMGAVQAEEASARFCERREVRFLPQTLLLVTCKSRQQAEASLERLRQLLAELGLEPKEAKTGPSLVRGIFADH